MLDKEIVENEGNENVLTSLNEAYQRDYPILAEYRPKMFKKAAQTERQESLVANVPPPAL